jgi:Uma2 family endonuclease
VHFKNKNSIFVKNKDMISNAIQLKSTKRKPLLPYKYEDRLQLPAVMRIPAELSDFVELLILCDYKVEYSNGDIVSILETDRTNPNIIMGNATLSHEEIIANLCYLLNIIFFRQPDFKIFGSNAKIFHTEELPIYNPDLTILKGKSETRLYKYRKQTQEVLSNPWLVIEVLSQGTREYDLVEKFANYRKIESLQQIVFVEQYWAEVSSYIRQPNGIWSYINLQKMTDELVVANSKISLADIYNKIEL